MWYFSWVLGALLICSLVIINLLRLESLDVLDSENMALDSLDSISQLLTRESILHMLRKKVAHSKQNSLPFSVMYLSLKDVKRRSRLTDYEMDSTLLKIADSLKKDIRVKKDMVARVGKEDFLLIIFSSSKKRAENVISRLKENVLAKIKTPARAIPIEVAVGIVEYSDESDVFALKEGEAESLLNKVIAKCFKA